MPTLTLPLECKVHFAYYKRELTNESWIDIGKTELPSHKDIEEFIWEAKDEWKED